MTHETKPDDRRCAGQPVAPATDEEIAKLRELGDGGDYQVRAHINIPPLYYGKPLASVRSLIARIDQERARAERAEAALRGLDAVDALFCVEDAGDCQGCARCRAKAVLVELRRKAAES